MGKDTSLIINKFVGGWPPWMLRCLRRTRSVAKSERTETSDTFTGEGGGGGGRPPKPPPRATTHGKVEVSELSPTTPERTPSLLPPASPVSISPLINYLGPENGRQPKWGVLERSGAAEEGKGNQKIPRS